jgi:hypothetical protein
LIKGKGNVIVIGGNQILPDIRFFSSILYYMVKDGYKNIILDFKNLDACFPDFMVPLCAIVNRHLAVGIDFELVLPENNTLKNLFVNSNWAHYIHSSFSKMPIERYEHVPLLNFTTPHEQRELVNNVVRSVLEKVRIIERPDLSALEWTLNEITDNVLTHSQSEIGGFAQCTFFNKKIEFVVCDQGVGIPGTLKRTQPNVTSDVKALESSIKKGVTRDKEIGQGNGLFGAWEITRLCSGEMSINSGKAHLFRKNGALRIDDDRKTFIGTLVVWTINLGFPDLLARAMSFGEKPYVHTDFLELNYEDEKSNILFKLTQEVESAGARLGNEKTRNKLRNLLHVFQNKIVFVDFLGFNLISSSFADEVFAKLMLEIGPCAFFHRIRFKNVNDLIVQIIDAAIIQRIKASN